MAGDGFIRVFRHFRVLGTLFAVGVGRFSVSDGGLPGPWRTSDHRVALLVMEVFKMEGLED